MISHHSKKHASEYARRLIIAVVLATAAQVTVQPITLATPQDNSRKIVSDDFTKNRKKGAQPSESTDNFATAKSANNTTTKLRARRTYKLISSSRKRPKQVSHKQPNPQLGITIWKLRPLQQVEQGARLLLREKSSSGWGAERVGADAMFREGDRVRLSVESALPGYLYVVDRDLLKHGKTGDAMLIYPWIDMTGGDNKVEPGKLVDIPAQEDNPNFFTARLTSPNQVGELLTIIVTPRPLDLPLTDKPLQISSVDLARWEKQWGTEIERFEMEGGAGEVWTIQEQQASARKGTRQLTRDDPAPQTIYRLPADNQAILVNVRLRYSKSQ